MKLTSEESTNLTENEFDGENLLQMDVKMLKECGFEETTSQKIVEAVEKRKKEESVLSLK